MYFLMFLCDLLNSIGFKVELDSVEEVIKTVKITIPYNSIKAEMLAIIMFFLSKIDNYT